MSFFSSATPYSPHLLRVCLSTGMSSNNSTTPDFRPVELNTLALGIIKDATLDAEDSIAELAPSSLLFGEELS